MAYLDMRRRMAQGEAAATFLSVHHLLLIPLRRQLRFRQKMEGDSLTDMCVLDLPVTLENRSNLVQKVRK